MPLVHVCKLPQRLEEVSLVLLRDEKQQWETLLLYCPVHHGEQIGRGVSRASQTRVAGYGYLEVVFLDFFGLWGC